MTEHPASHYLLIADGGEGTPSSLPVLVIPTPLAPESQRRLEAAGQGAGAYSECAGCGETLATREAVALIWGAVEGDAPEAMHLSCTVLADMVALVPAYVVEEWDVRAGVARHTYAPESDPWAWAS